MTKHTVPSTDNEYLSLLAERDRLREVNADLLAALEDCVDSIQAWRTSGEPDLTRFMVVQDKARAAIAESVNDALTSAEEGKP